MSGASPGGASSERDTVDCPSVRLTRTRPLGARMAPHDDPRTIGRYTVQRRVGVGGMSVVYEALDERIGRRVALKLMQVCDAGADRERLRREAQALARVSHPNVVEVFEIAEHEGKAYVVMALVEGEPLDRWLRSEPRRPAEIVEAFVQAGEGLAAAHAHGLVHRDFKPGNALMGHDGRVRVVDFGLVRESGAVEPSSSGLLPTPAEISVRTPLAAWKESLTRTGAMVGTPAYMSPEQLGGLAAGPASDQFSFCVALYEALWGQHPFVADGDWQQLPYNVLEGRATRPPKDRRVPAALVKVVMRGLALRPEARWPGMEALLHALRRALDRRGPGLPAVAVGLMVLGVGASAMHRSGQPPVTATCELAATTMRRTWNDEVREDTRDAWVGTGLPGAADTWARVDGRLQAHAEEWWDIHRAACDAEPRAVSSATCLLRWSEGLHAHLRVMARPNESLLYNAVRMVGELPSLERCNAALDAPPGAPAPAAPPWQDELDHVDALMRSGQYDQAAPRLEELLTRAAVEGSAGLAAEANLRLGYLRLGRAETEGAAAAFEEAYLAAKPQGLDEIAAQAAIALLQLYGELRYRPAEATRWAGHARAETERVDNPLLEVRFLNAWGRAQRSAGELERALELHQRALALQRTLPSASESDTAMSLFHIGTTLGLLGRGEEGQPYLEEALHLQEQVLGLRHPQVAATLTNMGVYLVYQGDFAGALGMLERALDIAVEAAPDNPAAGWAAVSNMGVIHGREGRSQQAAEMLRRYLDGYVRSREPVDVSPAHVEGTSCEIAMYEGDLPRARGHCERAVALQEETVAEGEAVWTSSHVLLGTVLGKLGRHEDALGVLRRAVELAQQVVAPVRGERLSNKHGSAAAVHELGRVLALMGRHGEALPVLERARAEYLADLEEDHPQPLDLEVDIGASLVALGRAGEALPRLRVAVGELERQTRQVALAQGLTALSMAELAVGDGAAACEHAERAVQLIETAAGPSSELAARPRFALARCLFASPRERARALTLARRAEEALAGQGGAMPRDLEEVRAWLAEHRTRATPRGPRPPA